MSHRSETEKSMKSMKSMKSILRALMLCTALAISATPAQAQVAYVPAGRHAACLESFYGLPPVDWYSVRNLCDEPVTVHYRAGDPAVNGCNGITILRPRAEANLGHSREEVQRCSGVALAVCPYGYTAVDFDGKIWGVGTSRQYRCREGYPGSSSPSAPSLAWLGLLD